MNLRVAEAASIQSLLCSFPGTTAWKWETVVADHCPLIMKLSSELVSANHNITAWCANYTGSARFLREESLPLFREALVGSDRISVVNLSLVHPEQACMEFFNIFRRLFDKFFPSLGCYLASKNVEG